MSPPAPLQGIFGSLIDNPLQPPTISFLNPALHVWRFLLQYEIFGILAVNLLSKVVPREFSPSSYLSSAVSGDGALRKR